MSSSTVDIVNLAYALIGHEANVVSISPPDTTAEASHAARFFPMCRDEVLEAHAWSFATRRTQLANITNEFTHWGLAYAYPTLCLRPLAVFLPGELDDTRGQPFEIAGDSSGNVVVLTNATDAVMKYIHAVSDTAKYPPAFITALAWLLASRLAGPVAKKPDIVAGAYQQHQIALAKAVALDMAGRKTAVFKNFVPGHLAVREGVGASSVLGRDS